MLGIKIKQKKIINQKKHHLRNYVRVDSSRYYTIWGKSAFDYLMFIQFITHF
jgi:hypothetical protein